MMKKLTLLSAAVLIACAPGAESQAGYEYEYGVPQVQWEESYGYHRAVIDVPQDTDAAELVYNWRRHGRNIPDHLFLIVNAETGDTLSNISRKQVDKEVCDIVFGPAKKGTYYFYYLPHEVQYQCGGCETKYYPVEAAPDPDWLAKASEPVQANVVRVEARSEFDSFYPMELAATVAEEKAYADANPGGAYLFPEDREHPIKMKYAIPFRWLSVKQGTAFNGVAAPNEYYAFQVGVWAANRQVSGISYSISDLQGSGAVIPASAVTCFNLEGVSPFGEALTYDVSVNPGNVQALWFGVDIPESQKRGTYKGVLTLSDASGVLGEVPVCIKVNGAVLADRGDSETWRYSRLRWLNSTLGLEDTPTIPYTAMTCSGNTVSCLGREVDFDVNSGIPEQIRALGNEILAAPLKFVIRYDGREASLTPKSGRVEEATAGHVSGTCISENEDLVLEYKARMEFDGWMSTTYTIKPKRDINIDDIRLELSVKPEVGRYFMGMGLQGQDTPVAYDGCWDKPVRLVDAGGTNASLPTGDDWTWPFDSFWIGRHDAGIHMEFRGTTYSGPLLNVYRPAYPDSWYNGGKGGFKVAKSASCVQVSAYSGSRKLQKDTPLSFEYAMIVTPVKPHNQEARFTERYYHTGSEDEVKPKDEDIKAGVKVVNVHHATPTNPFINYPYLTADLIKNFVDEMHSKGVKLKFYYTVREMSSMATEVWAARSLGHEIISPGKGGGFAWLQEHFEDDYTHQWYHHFEFDPVADRHVDAAVLMAEGNSRWCNYYVEGLAWMMRNTGADGIYMDDVTFDRRIMKRMRRAMESVKPGCLIDLHSNTWFSRGPATQYAEFFPYIDKIWFGESFRYNTMTPANYLSECSGIPFGLPGEMLEGGGNRWLGMQYGLTARCQWWTSGEVCNPRPVWKVWDEFGIVDSKMIGFWDEHPVATVNDPNVKVTAFVKDGKTLLSIGNYSDQDRSVKIDLDWEALGLDPAACVLRAPEVEDFQNACTWKPGDSIPVAPRRGWLIYVEK